MISIRSIFLLTLFFQTLSLYSHGATAEADMEKGFLAIVGNHEEQEFLAKFNAWTSVVQDNRAPIADGNPDIISDTWDTLRSHPRDEKFAFLLLSLTKRCVGKSCLLLGHIYHNKTQPSSVPENTSRANFWYTQALNDTSTQREAEINLGTRRDPAKEYGS